MIRTASRLACCLALALCCLAATARAESRQVFAHLFTVPTDHVDGGDAALKLPALEAWSSPSAATPGWEPATAAGKTSRDTPKPRPTPSSW